MISTRSGNALSRLLQRKWDIVAALAWTLLAGLRLASFLASPSLLQAGQFIFGMTIPLLLVLRRPAVAQGERWSFWLAVAVTVLPIVILRPVGNGLPQLGEIVQVVGLLIIMPAILTLSRSFGLAPAHRGLVMRGLYGIVRHPLYAGEILALLGYCLGYASGWNWVAFAVLFGGLITRIMAEERLLAADGEYRAYQQRVRWRLVPGLW
jgi:protein-S-isoprenylcysteine O-methyltransferase Ste14